MSRANLQELDYEKFLLRVANRKHPISGNRLQDGSAWLAPEILSEIDAFIKLDGNNPVFINENNAAEYQETTIIDQKKLLNLTGDQLKILSVIQNSPTGINFSALRYELGVSQGKLQGDLGAISSKVKKILGTTGKVFEKKSNGKYYPIKETTKTNLQNTDENEDEHSAYHDRVASIRKEHPNAYNPWTDEEEALLISLSQQGKTTNKIAAELGRQPGAIVSRLGQMNERDNAHEPEFYPSNLSNVEDDESLVIENSNEEMFDSAVYCVVCGDKIPSNRIYAQPNANTCINCASSKSFDKQKVMEKFGTREDYTKDRKSWTS